MNPLPRFQTGGLTVQIGRPERRHRRARRLPARPVHWGACHANNRRKKTA